MTFTHQIGYDLQRLIRSGRFDPIKLKPKMDFFLQRKRITQSEYNYLIELMETVVGDSIKADLEKADNEK